MSTVLDWMVLVGVPLLLLTRVVLAITWRAHRLLPDEDLSTFLPHLAVALPTAAGNPQELREILVPLREFKLGRQAVDNVPLGLVPLSDVISCSLGQSRRRFVLPRL